jgi:hypothetical protein
VLPLYLHSPLFRVVVYTVHMVESSWKVTPTGAVICITAVCGKGLFVLKARV